MPLFVLPAIAPPDGPMAPGWWPLPPGWWLVGMAIFMLAIWGASKLLRRMGPLRKRQKQQPDLKKMALAALDELERRESASERETAYRLNEILRAALLDIHASAGSWHPFTPRDDIDVDEAEWNAFWAELEMRYRPSATLDDGMSRRQQWLVVARRWLEQLPDDDGMRMQP